MAYKPLLIDVMLSDGSFYCQLTYTGMPFPLIIKGKVFLSYDMMELRRFAIEKRPSLASKSFNVCLTDQRVY